MDDGDTGAVAVALDYFAAWNRHAPDEIVTRFSADGTYSDPATGGSLTGQAIGAYAAVLFTAFSDLTFEFASTTLAGDGRVIGEWIMRGTHTGPLAGAPPTGRTVALPGVDLITVEGDKIRAVQGYFDQKTFLEQLGL